MKRVLTLLPTLVVLILISLSFQQLPKVQAETCPGNWQEVGGGCACDSLGITVSLEEAATRACPADSSGGANTGNNGSGGANTGNNGSGGANPGDPGSGTREQLTNITPWGSLCDLINAILNIVTEIGAIIAVLFIIWSGFLFIKAQGNPKEIEDAKRAFYATIIGTAILLGSSVIAKIIITTIGAVSNSAGNSIC